MALDWSADTSDAALVEASALHSVILHSTAPRRELAASTGQAVLGSAATHSEAPHLNRMRLLKHG